MAVAAALGVRVFFAELVFFVVSETLTMDPTDGRQG
jgi:hypothetical protein